MRVVDIFGTWRTRTAGGYDEDVRANGVFLGVDNAEGYRLAVDRGEQMLTTWVAETRARGRRPIVVYQAGVDPYEHDRVGGIAGVTAAVLAERDARVFAPVRNLAVPVVVVLAGGYSADCVPMHVTTLRIATSTEPMAASAAKIGRMT